MKPTRPTERDEDKAAILEQRKSAVDFWSTAKSGTLKKNKTQLALFDPPPLKSNRMSQMGTLGRGVMIKKIEEAASPNSKAIKAREGAGGLIKRLRDLGMASIEMQGDGNCQFRALADQLFGSQEHHAFVRALAIAHMQAQSDFFSIYFEDEREWNEYIRGMARSRTWRRADAACMRRGVYALRTSLLRARKLVPGLHTGGTADADALAAECEEWPDA